MCAGGVIIKLYLYGLRYSPYGSGFYPTIGLYDDDFNIYSIGIKESVYHSHLIYDRELSEEELETYEMDYIGYVELFAPLGMTSIDYDRFLK